MAEMKDNNLAMDLAMRYVIKKSPKKFIELENSEYSQYFLEIANEYRSLLAAALALLGNNNEDDHLEFKLKFLDMTNQAKCLTRRVDEFQDKHFKYNIPYLDHRSFKDYLKDLEEFMTIWRKETKKGRRKGEKSLIKWMQQLDQSQRKTTFEEMKKVVIGLGTNISWIIIDFLFVVMILGDRINIMKNLDYFKAMIKLLNVEKNSNDSIVIKTFLCVIQLVEKTMRKNKQSLIVNRTAKNDDGIEFELLRMILKEVLRLEVALCCPDLPMVLTDEVSLSMGNHLTNFFETKLSDVNLKMNELRMEALSLHVVRNHKEAMKLNFAKQTVAIGTRKIWNKLDL
uniref:Uncharacterized protein n=1 Tax=Cannabis sativa TaxID=3483 RepID=A0A803QDY9_CANSA